ncbi:hypothetical protein EJB05_14503, partial [Eragrostis curvula]
LLPLQLSGTPGAVVQVQLGGAPPSAACQDRPATVLLEPREHLCLCGPCTDACCYDPTIACWVCRDAVLRAGPRHRDAVRLRAEGHQAVDAIWFNLDPVKDPPSSRAASRCAKSGGARPSAKSVARCGSTPPRLYGSGLYPIGIQAHASAAHPEQQRLAPMPFLVGDEELNFGWLGSFRLAAVTVSTTPAGSAAFGSADSGVVHASEEPDLTLRL